MSYYIVKFQKILFKSREFRSIKKSKQNQNSKQNQVALKKEKTKNTTMKQMLKNFYVTFSLRNLMNMKNILYATLKCEQPSICI